MVHGQSVRFLNNNLQSAITMAQSSNKLIFVDTYAPWCIPCKKMEKVFRDPQLSSYFNATFINIRIDMDSEYGKEVHRKYDVIFLPTLMILDQDGRVKYKVDRVISAKDLLDIAQKIAQPEIYAYKPEKQVAVAGPDLRPSIPKPSQTKSAVISKPKPILEAKVKPQETIVNTKGKEEKLVVSNEIAKEKKDIIEGTITEERIIHVFDENAKDLPPGLLKQQAYLSLQLMDGSHRKAARKYLDTQDDWSTKENIRFIFDFLSSTGTKEFQHLMNNRLLYEEIIGTERVYKTISILVYDRLDRGFPRPTLDETKDLFSYIGNQNHERGAYEHYLEAQYKAGNLQNFNRVGEEYLDLYKVENDQMYYRLANASSENGEQLSRSVKYINKAIDINPYNFQYYDTKAYLHYMLGQKQKATKAATKARELAMKNNIKTDQIDILIEMIQEDL